MKSSFFRLPENIDPKARNAFLLIALLFVAALLVTGILVFQGFRTPSPQLWAVAIGVCVTDVFLMAGLILAMRGRHELAIWLALMPLLLEWILAAAMLAGLGYMLMTLAAVTFILVAGLTLSSRPAIVFGIIGVVGAVIILLVDIFIPITRLSLTAFNMIVNYLVGAILLVFAFIIIRQYRNYSLRAKLITAFLAVTLIPLMIVAYLNYRASSNALIGSTEEKLFGAAQQTAAQLDEFMQSNIEAVRIEAQMKDVLEYLALPTFQRRGSEQEAHLQAFLATLIRQNPIYIDSIAIIDTRGITLYDTYTADIGTDKSDRRYFQDVMKTGRPLASDVEFSQTSGAASLYFAAPVRDSSGKIIAVLRKRFNAAILQKYLTANNGLVGEGSFPMLVDNETFIRLGHGNLPELNFKSIVPLDAIVLAELQAARHMPPGTVEELSTNLPDLLVGLQNYVESPFFVAEFRLGDNTPEQGAVTLMQTQPWLVVFAQSQNTFLAPTTAQANNSILIALALAFVVAAAGFFVSQTLAGPILRLTHTAETIAGGDINVQAKVESQDEVGTLASAFNNMTARLREFIGTLEERVAERTKDQATVANIATRTANIQNLEEMLATMVHLTQRGFGLYHAHVFLYHADTEELKIVACGYKEGDEHEGTHGTTSIPIHQEQSLVARAGRTRQPVIVNDVRSDPGWLPNPLLPDTHAEMAVPMIVGDKLLGVLDVQADHVDAFDEADATIQMTLAAQVAVAVQNIMQFQITQKVASDLGVVAEVGIATATITETDRLLQEVVDISKRSFKLYHVHIYLVDEAGDTLELAAGAGEVGRQMVAEGRSIPLDSEKSLVARAARTREGVVVNDVTLNPDFLPNPLLPNTRAEMAVPMVVANKVIGVLDVQSEQVGRFTEIDVNIKTTLASQIAVALENAHSFQNAQKRAERETKLNLITQKIQNAATIEEALQTAARELGHALGRRQTLVALDPKVLSSHVGVADEAKE